MNPRRIINKQLSAIGSHIKAVSELPLIGNINDIEGFLDDVCKADVEYRINVYITKPTCNKERFDHTIKKLSEIMEHRGYLLEIHC